MIRPSKNKFVNKKTTQFDRVVIILVWIFRFERCIPSRIIYKLSAVPTKKRIIPDANKASMSIFHLTNTEIDMRIIILKAYLPPKNPLRKDVVLSSPALNLTQFVIASDTILLSKNGNPFAKLSMLSLPLHSLLLLFWCSTVPLFS
jgi:hypothetical protein